MQPTFGQVIDIARSLHLGAPQSVFPDDVMLKAAKRAVDELTSVFKHHQLPDTKIISSPITVAAGSVELDTTDEGLSDFGSIIKLEERPSGSTEQYVEVRVVEELPQRDATATLNECTVRQGKFQFVGASADVDVRIHYYASGAAENLDQDATIAIDDSLNFLAAATAAKAGKGKGYTVEAKEARDEAYGADNRTPLTFLGGYLQQLVEPLCRVQQQTPVVPAMYRAGR